MRNLYQIGPKKMCLVNSGNQISIVIVTYNSEKYILKNLRSIEKYCKNIINQIIISDSNSTDDTLSIVEKYFPNVEIIKGENKGYGAALNAGFKKCINEIIIGANDDMYFLDNSLSNVFQTFESQRNIGIVGPQILNDDKTLQRSITNNPNIIKDSFQIIFPKIINTNNSYFKSIIGILQNFFSIGRFDNHNKEKIVTAVKGAFFIFRKKVFQDTNGFDERIAFDTEEQIFCLKAKNMGWSTLYNPSIKIVHIAGASLGSPGSQNNIKRFSVKIQSTLLFYRYYKFFFWFILSYLSFVISVSIRVSYLLLTNHNDWKKMFGVLKLLLLNKIISTQIYRN